MTRRYCACGDAYWTQAGLVIHLSHGRPGCHEVTVAEWAALRRRAALRCAS